MSSFVKLKDVCLKITDGSHYSPVGIASGIAMLSVKDMQHANFNYSNCKFISKKDYEALVKADCKPLKNDVLIAKDGSYLKHVFVVDEEIEQAILSSIGILRPNLELIDPYYLKYYLHTASVKEIVSKKYVSGSALPRIILKNFGEIDIINKSLPAQQEISSILSALDYKINLNIKINEELESMVRTIYEYWFVQFDFPWKNGKPYKSSGGKMIYNEILRRKIPEDWKDGTLDCLGDILGGSTPSKAIEEYFTIHANSWITPKDLSLNGSNKFITKGQLDVTDKGMQAASLKLIPKGSILLSSRAPIGYLAIANKSVTTNQGFKSFVPNKGYSTEYLFYTIKNSLPQIISNASGSTFKEISGSVLKNIKILLPCKKLVENYSEMVAPIFGRQNLLEEENKQLANLRDWLLPMLMNGQVSVGKTHEQKNGLLISTTGDLDKYKNSAHSSIPKNKTIFAKQVLAGKIVSLFKNDKSFTRIKFQKLQFLSEHIAEADLNLNYYFQTAGPYDNIFMHTVFDSFRKSKWFDEINYKFIELEKQDQIEKYYKEYFSSVSNRLDKLFKLLFKTTEEEAEIIATIYAVWNNRIILKQPISIKALVEDFYNWSERKHKYSLTQVNNAIRWLKSNEFEPNGFGKEIKRAKKNKLQ